MDAAKWSELAFLFVDELARVAWATRDWNKPSDESDERIRAKGEMIRGAVGRVTSKLEELELAGKDVALDPGAEDLQTWRTRHPGIMRCGDTVEVSAHEVALLGGTAIFDQIKYSERLDDDDLIGVAGSILDDHLDRDGLKELAAHLRGEYIPPRKADAKDRTKKKAKNDARDKWIYERLFDINTPLKNVVNELYSVCQTKDWEPITTVQGLRPRALMYAKKHGKKEPPSRKD